MVVLVLLQTINKLNFIQHLLLETKSFVFQHILKIILFLQTWNKPHTFGPKDKGEQTETELLSYYWTEPTNL